MSSRCAGRLSWRFTQREAKGLGLQRFVRNLADGRVEVVAQGPPEEVGKLLEKLGRGPRGARVDKVEAREVLALDVYQEFEVER